MDKGWSPIWAHWTPTAPVEKVRVRAQTVHGKGEGHNSRIYSSSRGSVIGVMLPEGPHGMVEAAARKRRCPAPTRAVPGARASGCRTNLTPVGCCQAQSCPGQPRASLAKPLRAGKNREQGGGHPAASNASQCQLLGGVVQPQALSMQHPGSSISRISKGEKLGWVIQQLGGSQCHKEQPHRKICSWGSTSLSSGGG